MSELNIMDDNFQSVYQPFGEGNAFPGLLSVLVVIDQRSMPDTHKVIAFGGNVNSMRGRHSASVGFIVCVASCLGVGAGCLCVCVCGCVWLWLWLCKPMPDGWEPRGGWGNRFSMDRDGVRKENLAYCFVPGVNVLMGSFLYPSQNSDNTLLFASVIVNITTSHLHVPFVEVSSPCVNPHVHPRCAISFLTGGVSCGTDGPLPNGGDLQLVVHACTAMGSRPYRR